VDRRFAAQTLGLQEEKLQQSEAYLAEAQRLSHTGSFGWKPSTGEIIWSEETFRIFQYDRSTKPTVELVLQRVHPEDAVLEKQIIERASRDGRDFDFEHRLLMPDGSVKYVHVVAHALNDASGSVEFVGAVMDVTAAKRAEEALRRSESYVAEAQRLTHTGSWAWQVAGRDALHLSEEWYRLYGFDPEKGPPAWEERLQRVHPEDRAKWQGVIERAIGEKSNYDVEFRILLPDGTVKYIHTVGHPVLNASGDLVEFVGSSTDITEQKRAEVLLASENRLLEMIAKGDSRVLILDTICRLVEELASGSLPSILLVDPSANRLRHGAAPSLPSPYNEAVDGVAIGPSAGSCGTAAYRAEPVIVLRHQHDPLWADYRDVALAHGLRACWSTPILSSAGKVLGTFAIYYREPRSPTALDHSFIKQIVHLASIAVERKQAEEALEALRQAQADLARITRVTTMGELTASLAHEVNQPIAAANTNANTCLRWLAGDTPNIEEARAAAMRIVKDGKRAAEIITRVRQLFKKGTLATGACGRKRDYSGDDCSSAWRDHSIQNISRHGPCGRSSPGHGRRRAITAGDDEPHDQCHRSDEGRAWDARARHQVAANAKRGNGGVRHRQRRGATPTADGTDLQCLLYYQAARDGHGTSYQPLHHRITWWPLVGCRQHPTRRKFLFQSTHQAEAHE